MQFHTEKTERERSGCECVIVCCKYRVSPPLRQGQFAQGEQRLAQGADAAALCATLPQHARPHLIRCPIRDFGNDEGGLIARTATHVSPSAALAYPAAALLAAGVDLPVSLIGSAVGYTAVGIYALFNPTSIFR